MPGDIIALARRFMNQPIHIRTQDSQDEGSVVTRIKQHVLRAHALDKVEMLARSLQADGRGPTMVFCRQNKLRKKPLKSSSSVASKPLQSTETLDKMLARKL
jgi:superfamily II DNA/RNA helicase